MIIVYSCERNLFSIGDEVHQVESEAVRSTPRSEQRLHNTDKLRADKDIILEHEGHIYVVFDHVLVHAQVADCGADFASEQGSPFSAKRTPRNRPNLIRRQSPAVEGLPNLRDNSCGCERRQGRKATLNILRQVDHEGGNRENRCRLMSLKYFKVAHRSKCYVRKRSLNRVPLRFGGRVAQYREQAHMSHFGKRRNNTFFLRKRAKKRTSMSAPGSPRNETQPDDARY